MIKKFEKKASFSCIDTLFCFTLEVLTSFRIFAIFLIFFLFILILKSIATSKFTPDSGVVKRKMLKARLHHDSDIAIVIWKNITVAVDNVTIMKQSSNLHDKKSRYFRESGICYQCQTLFSETKYQIELRWKNSIYLMIFTSLRW